MDFVKESTESVIVTLFTSLPAPGSNFNFTLGSGGSKLMAILLGLGTVSMFEIIIPCSKVEVAIMASIPVK
jgi:hypothetical protein